MIWVNRLLTHDKGGVRFFFFLPAPAGPLVGGASCGLGAVEGAFGVGAFGEDAAGVGAD